MSAINTLLGLLMFNRFPAFQITRWVCTPLLDPNEGQDQLSLRNFGESGCEGYTLWEQDDGSYSGAFSGNEEPDTFHFNEDDLTFTAKFPDQVRSGTCTDARGNDVCQTFSAACSISILYDCKYTD